MVIASLWWIKKAGCPLSRASPLPLVNPPIRRTITQTRIYVLFPLGGLYRFFDQGRLSCLHCAVSQECDSNKKTAAFQFLIVCLRYPFHKKSPLIRSPPYILSSVYFWFFIHHPSTMVPTYVSTPQWNTLRSPSEFNGSSRGRFFLTLCFNNRIIA